MAGKKLEDRIFFDSSEQTFNLIQNRGLKAENAVINDAYFGRWPNDAGLKQGEEASLGLYVTVEFEAGGEAAVSYTSMDVIGDFMREFGVRRTEKLNGQMVTAYKVTHNTLVGLSARRQ